MDKTARITLQIMAAAIGIILWLAGYAMAEPKSVWTDDQKVVMAGKQDGKDKLKGIKPSDIDACADVACLQPILKKMLRAIKDNSGVN